MRHPLSSVEPLESRIAPAGILYVTYANGNLTITGDAARHEFDLTSNGDVSATLYPGTDTLLKIGSAPPTSEPLVFASMTGDVRIVLGAGDDFVSFGDLNYVRNFSLNLGGGENAASFSSLDSRGSFTVLGGKGGDFLSFGGSEDSAIVVRGDFTLRTDQGQSNVSISAQRFEVGGHLRFASGTGDDEFAASADYFHVGGDASFSFSRGQNLLALSASGESDIAGKLTVTANSGLSPYSVATNTTVNVVADSHFRFGRDVSITTGSSDDIVGFFGGDLAFGGNVKALLGRGNDSFQINSLSSSIVGSLMVRGDLNLSTRIDAPNGLTIERDLKVLGGTDSDVFVLDAPAVIFGRTSIDLGRGLGAAGIGFATVDFRSSNSTFDSVFLGGLDIRFSAGPDAASAGGSVSIQQAILGGPSSIRTGVGGDVIGLERITVNAPFTIATGNGDDTLFWEIGPGVAGPSIISAPVSIAFEAGDDNMVIGDGTIDDHARFFVRSTISGGTGLDAIDYLLRGNVLAPEPTVRQFEVVS